MKIATGTVRTNMKRTLIALGIVLLMAICNACKGNEGNSAIPRELQGAWVTDDPQFADRLIKFWPSEYVILTGVGSNSAVQTVDKVEKQQFGNGFTLTIYASNRAGAQDQMGVTYSPANGGELRFRNQKQVWKRVPEN